MRISGVDYRKAIKFFMIILLIYGFNKHFKV